jgi:hypothetical protein
MNLVALFMIKHQKLAVRNENLGQQQCESVTFVTRCVHFLTCYALDTFFINSVVAEILRGILAFSFQQDKQCTYNLMFRRVYLTVVAEEKQLCSECIVELRAACQQYKYIECCTTVRLWRIFFLSNCTPAVVQGDIIL